MRNVLDVMALLDTPPYTTVTPPLYRPAMIQHHLVTRKTAAPNCALCQSPVAAPHMQRHLCHECTGMPQLRERHHDSMCSFLARSGSCFWTAPVLRTGDIAAASHDHTRIADEHHRPDANDKTP